MSYADVERTEILARLDRVEAENGVRVVYAVESGSRAWGFASPDSDWDIRFVYAAPLEGYLTVKARRDVIEHPVDARGLDLAGWDLRKALGLLVASNPALLEWLVSPIVYRDDGVFRDAAMALFEAYASRRALARHYRSIAVAHWRRSLETGDAVKLKVYFYVVRSVAALDWIAAGRGLPPMAFADLIAAAALPAEVRDDLAALVALKTASAELGSGARRLALDRYVTDTLDRVDPATIEDRAELRPALEAAADALFRRMLGVGEKAGRP